MLRIEGLCAFGALVKRQMNGKRYLSLLHSSDEQAQSSDEFCDHSVNYFYRRNKYKMKFEAGNWYHIYNQGNNQQRIFYEKENYLFFLSKIKVLPRDDFNIIAYCLMPNHFHLLIYTDFGREYEILKSKKYSRKLGSLLSSYAKAINKKYRRSGSLFRQKTKAKCLSSTRQSGERYIRTCFHYIHQNPLRAGIISDLHQWAFSSYRDYAGLRNGTLPDLERGNKMLEFHSKEQFIKESQKAIDPQLVKNFF